MFLADLAPLLTVGLAVTDDSDTGVVVLVANSNPSDTVG